MKRTTLFLKLLVIGFLVVSTAGYTQGPNFAALMQGIASTVNQPKTNQNANSVATFGGGLAKQQAPKIALPASLGNIATAPEVAPTQEYRGFNGRTAKQAFFACKYDSYRAAAPGLKRLKLVEKMRIRMYVMDACMNKEGFFRKKGSLRIPSLSTLTAADFGF